MATVKQSGPVAAAGRSKPSPPPRPKPTKPKAAAKRRRSTRGHGSVYKRKRDGLWIVATSKGVDPTTGRRRRNVRAFASEAEAKQFYKKALVQVLVGAAPVTDSNMQLSVYLNQWLADTRAALVNGTWHSRESNVRLHINPKQALGRFTLRELDHPKLNTWLNSTLVSGWPNPINPKKNTGAVDYLTRRQARAVLHKALEDARLNGVISSNPMTKMLKVVGNREELRRTRPLTVTEARSFLRAVAKRYKAKPEWIAPWWILTVAGLRAGEMLGQREFDFVPRHKKEPAKLKVEVQLQRRRSADDSGTPANGDDKQLIVPLKTSGSHRTLVIPDNVAAHIETRLALNAGIRKKFPNWNPSQLLFCQSDGTNFVYEDMWREFRELLKSAGLPVSTSTNPSGHNPHDLRATAVCAAALEGADLATLMLMLGHSSPRMTLEYLKSLEGMQAQVARRLNKTYAGIK